MSDKPDLSGKWLFLKQENFEGFMAENGVPYLIRKAAGLSKPTCTIEQNGDDFDVKLISMVKTQQDKFTIGIDFQQTQPNGATFRVTPSWDGNKLVLSLEPTGNSGKAQKHIRYIEDDNLVLELEIGEVKAKRWFKRDPQSAAKTEEEKPAEKKEEENAAKE